MTSRRNLATLLKFFDDLLLCDLRLILLISTIHLPRDWVHFLVQTFLLLGFLSFCRVFLAQNKAALQPEKILKYEDDLCPCVGCLSTCTVSLSSPPSSQTMWRCLRRSPRICPLSFLPEAGWPCCGAWGPPPPHCPWGWGDTPRRAAWEEWSWTCQHYHLLLTTTYSPAIDFVVLVQTDVNSLGHAGPTVLLPPVLIYNWQVRVRPSGQSVVCQGWHMATLSRAPEIDKSTISGGEYSGEERRSVPGPCLHSLSQVYSYTSHSPLLSASLCHLFIFPTDGSADLVR